MPYIGKSPSFGVRNRFVYVMSTSGATSVSGADANGATLTFTDGAYVDVYLNGVLLKPTTDYNTSTAGTIAGLSALNTNDEVTVVVYDVFTVADMVSATSGGTFSGNVNFSGAFTSLGIDDNADATAITIDSSERVGIGTTSPAQLLHVKADNPGGKIRLEMGQTGVANTDVTGEIQFYHNDASGAGVNADIKGICTNSAGAGALTFGTGTTSTTERMRIASDGKLTVTMSSDNTNAEADIGAVHILKNTSSTNGSGSMLCLGSNSNFGTGIYGQLVDSSTNEHKLGFQVRNSSGSSGTRLLLTGDGNLGLGTISPLGFTTGNGLHMGDGRSVGFGDGANSRPDFQISCINGSALDFRCGNGADTADLTINTSGLFSGDFNDTSDERLKENIKDIADNQIAILKQLRPVTFDWKEKGKGNDTGFIAQEVKKLLPNDVHYQNPETYESESDLPIYNERDKEDGLIPDGKKVGDKVDDTIKVGDMINPDSMMAINLQGVVAVLTKALQEAVARIEALESK